MRKDIGKVVVSLIVMFLVFTMGITEYKNRKYAHRMGPAFEVAEAGNMMPDNAKKDILNGLMSLTTNTHVWRLYTVDASALSSTVSTTYCPFANEFSGGAYTAITVTAAPASGSTVTVSLAGSNTAIFDVGDPVWTGLTGTAQSIALCDVTAATGTDRGKLVSAWGFTATYLSSGTLTVTIPAADSSNALLRLN